MKLLDGVELTKPNQMKAEKPYFQLLAPPFQADLVEGHLFSEWWTLPINNLHHRELLIVHEVSVSSSDLSIVETNVDQLSILPGQLFPVQFRLVSKKKKRLINECSASNSLKFTLTISTSLGDEASTLFYRCRTLKQSFLFTFLAEDGSVQHAATVLPFAANAGAIYPTLLTLHGTTIKPQDQADSYKQKLKQDSDDYLFGVEQAWVLAPTRHGAHNWEGVGAWTAMQALNTLQTLTLNNMHWLGCAASAFRVIFAGHSMGGHGAWVLASNFGNRAIGLISIAGWTVKEEYGDSNLFFRHDVSNSFIQPVHKLILESTIAENAVDRQVENLKNIPVLIRVGASDKTVHPYYSRKMHRLLRFFNASSVTFEEIKGKEHWWWDTERPNDGGVVNDPAMRTFINKLTTDQVLSNPSCEKKGNACNLGKSAVFDAPFNYSRTFFNPVFGEFIDGLSIAYQIVPYRKSEIRIVARTAELLHVYTENIQAFQIDGHALLHNGKKKVFVNNVEVKIPSKKKQQVKLLLVNSTTWLPVEQFPFKKSVKQLGSPKHVFQGKFSIVVTDAKLLKLAVYLSNLFYLTAHFQAPIILHSDLLESTNNNLVTIGLLNDSFVKESLNQLPSLQVNKENLKLHSCIFHNHPLGILALTPSSKNVNLVLTANSIQDLNTVVVGLAKPTIPPMVRAPFSNMIPDFILFDPAAFQSKGPGSFLCSGFWDNDWQYSSISSTCIC